MSRNCAAPIDREGDEKGKEEGEKGRREGKYEEDLRHARHATVLVRSMRTCERNLVKETKKKRRVNAQFAG